MSSYDRRTVEVLLPAVWNDEYAWGVVNEYAPEGDMPKSKAAKNASNTLYAMLADVRQAWKRATFTERERQALVLMGGMDYPVALAGETLGVSKQRIQQLYDAGVGRMVGYLNGVSYVEDGLADTDEWV